MRHDSGRNCGDWDEDCERDGGGEKVGYPQENPAACELGISGDMKAQLKGIVPPVWGKEKLGLNMPGRGYIKAVSERGSAVRWPRNVPYSPPWTAPSDMWAVLARRWCVNICTRRLADSVQGHGSYRASLETKWSMREGTKRIIVIDVLL